MDSSPRNLLRTAVAVFLLVLGSVGQAISMAALIFAGGLESGLPRAVSTFVVGSGLIVLFLGWRSTIVPLAAIIQDGPAIVAVTVAASVGLNGGLAAPVNVFVMLGIVSASTGVAMWLLGRFQVGGLVRYMPTTVVSAFLAGTGWLLAKGGVDVMVGSSLGLSDIADIASWDLMKFWLPGVVLGVMAWLIGRSDRLPAVAVGASILLAIAIFYLVTSMTSSVDAVEQEGWLVGPFPAGSGPSLISPQEAADADWGSIAAAIPGMASIVAVSILVLLLNLTGLAAQRRVRLDINHELRNSAYANLLVSPFGVSPGFLAIGDSLLLDRVGGRGRRVAVVSGVLLLLFGIAGVGAVQYVPRLVVGAILVTVGLELLIDWVHEVRHSVERTEQLLSIGILVVIASVGILEGIGVGLLAACALFIVRYSRVDPVREVVSGAQVSSHVDRTMTEAEVLRTLAERRLVVELQGYLFFGWLTAIEDRFGDAGQDTLDVLVIDFRSVTGIDSSAYSAIANLVADYVDDGVDVVFSALDPRFRSSLLSSSPELEHVAEWASTLEKALEVAEESQLQHAELPAAVTALALDNDVLDEFEPVSFDEGHTIMESGAPSDGVMLVSQGSLSAYFVDVDGVRHRLRRFGAGSLVGEIGLVTGGPRSADIVADTVVEGYWLTRHRYEALRVEKPDVVVVIYELIMQVQAERVVSLSSRAKR